MGTRLGRVDRHGLRPVLAAAMRERRPEIERSVFARVRALEDPEDRAEGSYLLGLRRTVVSALEYAMATIERGEARPEPIPTQLFAQAREAAGEGVSLDTVLRRYFAGYTVFGDFLHRCASGLGILDDDRFQRILREQGALLDRMLAAVADEYCRALEASRLDPESRRIALVRRLLAGELLDSQELAFPLEGWHLAVVGIGAGVQEQMRELASALDRRLLLVRGGAETSWCWLGGGRPFQPDEVARIGCWKWDPSSRVAFGEPGSGVEGWRLSHRQASAAAALVLHGDRAVVRYGEVALLASISQDETLTASLRQMYLDPLRGERDSGAALLETLRAYFAAERNSASAASALGVARQTVNNRLRLVEERLGMPLGRCAADLELALELDLFQGANRTAPS